ncbi:MAG: hypothetical protein GY859_36775, partial [Desulfobacterales bacterium]|nr:hypothetical protein [Desulfobacterales bacterium]
MNKQKVAKKFDLLIILAVAIPVLAISVIITGYLLHQYVDDVHEKDALHLKGLVSSVQWFLDNAFSLNYQLSINPQILEQIASAEKDWGLRRRLYNEQYGDGPFSDGSGPPLLVEMQKKYDFLDLLFVQDADGNQAGRSFGALGKRGERWWFKKIMGDDKPRAFVSRSYYSITGAKPVASVFHPIHQGDRLVGVMGADINFEKLQKVVQSYLAAKDLYAIVLDNQGVIIAHPISAKVREMHNLKKLTRRILLTDDAGRPIMGADGYHKTEEAPLEWDQRASLLTSEVLMGRSGIFQDISMDRQNLTIYYEPVALPGDGSVGN